ncbi:hypothetical protein SISSUDRAFT_1033780 [Sistotremastrum suecicum HHB10207 ss-3]|uniref:Uncharacterized protein n=1 Tax=Sistotremastrum suecicum HHB10207 ss-3 TaxID=1314776 RepID=A0A166CVK8_9AGAM|nr:hypothetical protein SISSUDRAFT_1033780 [Sistotremastrum suecicum HHB10207 ss-3]
MKSKRRARRLRMRESNEGDICLCDKSKFEMTPEWPRAKVDCQSIARTVAQQGAGYVVETLASDELDLKIRAFQPLTHEWRRTKSWIYSTALIQSKNALQEAILHQDQRCNLLKDLGPACIWMDSVTCRCQRKRRVGFGYPVDELNGTDAQRGLFIALNALESSESSDPRRPE